MEEIDNDVATCYVALLTANFIGSCPPLVFRHPHLQPWYAIGLFVCDVCCQTNRRQSSEETGLPPGWEVRRSNTKNLPYYFHAATKDSRWEPPAGTDPVLLKNYMASHHSSKGVAPAAFQSDGSKIRCAHLLVKHRDSRRPASWREPKITRSKEEARALIQGYQQQINAYESGTGDANAKSLSELATTESDCSSARKGGDL